LRVLGHIDGGLLVGLHVDVAFPNRLAFFGYGEVMMSDRENQLLLPNPEIIVHFVDMADEILGLGSIGENGGMRPPSAEVDAAPGAVHGTAVSLEDDVQIGRLARGDVHILCRDLEAIVHYSDGVLTGGEWKGAARPFMHRLAVDKNVRLFRRDLNLQLPVLREAGACTERDSRHEGEQASESSHQLFS